MDIGKAVAAMKSGARVRRAGWNGKGMFAYYVPAASYPVQTGAAKAHFGEGAMIPYRAYLALKTADNDVATWAPSVGDTLADDWEIVDDEARTTARQTEQEIPLGEDDDAPTGRLIGEPDAAEKAPDFNR